MRYEGKQENNIEICMRTALGSKNSRKLHFLAKWVPTSSSWGTSHCYSVSKSIYIQLYKANATAYITSKIEENSHGSGSKHGIHFHHHFFEIFQKTCKVGTLGRPWENCFDNSPGQMEASGAQILHAPIYKFILPGSPPPFFDFRQFWRRVYKINPKITQIALGGPVAVWPYHGRWRRVLRTM